MRLANARLVDLPVDYLHPRRLGLKPISLKQTELSADKGHARVSPDVLFQVFISA